MPYNKKGPSDVVDNSKKKLDAMIKIDAKLKEESSDAEPVNYGSKKEPLTTTELAAQLKLYDSINTEYDQAMNAVSAVQNRMEAVENTLKEMNKMILSSAVGEFGDDSDEYEALGGTRKSDRKKPGRRPPTPPAQ
ncbi:MAG: hypothetical protein M1480_07615 [Bacteroidetes bacterium]|nr:hypothetical protein [Bacteroidota bacterium]